MHLHNYKLQHFIKTTAFTKISASRPGHEKETAETNSTVLRTTLARITRFVLFPPVSSKDVRSRRGAMSRKYLFPSQQTIHRETYEIRNVG